ncbi:M20/M25/M40 family metallo-hydrolase [Romboutsia maritimum]|uniref:M20/M25/M40 family metallo-hydrolase n=1 Tax=Romboutsia maritimum TaxID=2020948 RepID=A0A371IPZ7_9FIRM|nr:M20/M25/M40 family metallo-hydrolase [Romboutsia maritimum]RDY22543.1 M20/M25/M40 family metallo-hydrolase [Romboutsia maritimum]
MWSKKDDLLNLTLELVAQKSVSATRDEKCMAKLVHKKLSELRYYKENPKHLFIEPVNDDLDRYFVCALMKSKKKTDKTLLTIAHMDTADIKNAGILKEYILNPYKYTEKLKENIDMLDEDSKKDLLSGKWLFGRGIMDMKMGLAMQMSLIDYYSEKEDFEGNILVIAVPDEESNSQGAISAIPFVNKIIKEHNLKPLAVLNSEPDFGLYPGDDNKYIYLGSCGKLLPGFYIVGEEVHVGESLSGLNPNLIGAEILSRMDLNIDLCEKVGNEVPMPPTCLKYEDTKKDYNIQMPPSSIMYYNLQTLNSNPKLIISKLKEICNEAAKSVIDKVKKSKQQYTKLSGLEFEDDNLDIKVFTFDELYNKAYAQFGEEFRSHLDEKIGNWVNDDSLDDRDISTNIVKLLCDYVKNEGPCIVIFFALPYYPHVGINENEEASSKILDVVNNTIKIAKEKYDIDIRIQKYFKGISDLSYFALQDADEVIQYLKPNMPSLGYRYKLPLEEIRKLNVPVLNYGPHGKDPHKFTERILVDYSYEITPRLVREIVEGILSI